MSVNASSGLERKETELLHYYSSKNTSVKLVREGDKYLIVRRKYILHFFRNIKSLEFKNYCEAEDLYLELKALLLFYARAY